MSLLPGEKLEFKIGDRVTWIYKPRGGYCEPQAIAATVVGLSAKRVRIRVNRKTATGWKPEEKSVSAWSLRALAKGEVKP